MESTFPNQVDIMTEPLSAIADNLQHVLDVEIAFVMGRSAEVAQVKQQLLG